MPRRPLFSADETMAWASKLEKPILKSTERSMEGDVCVYASSTRGSTISRASSQNLSLSSSSDNPASLLRLVSKSDALPQARESCRIDLDIYFPYYPGHVCFRLPGLLGQNFNSCSFLGGSASLRCSSGCKRRILSRSFLQRRREKSGMTIVSRDILPRIAAPLSRWPWQN